MCVSEKYVSHRLSDLEKKSNDFRHVYLETLLHMCFCVVHSYKTTHLFSYIDACILVIKMKR